MGCLKLCEEWNEFICTRYLKECISHNKYRLNSTTNKSSFKSHSISPSKIWPIVPANWVIIFKQLSYRWDTLDQLGSENLSCNTHSPLKNSCTSSSILSLPIQYFWQFMTWFTQQLFLNHSSSLITIYITFILC